MDHFIGLDIGGTKIYGALYDQDWNVLKDLQVPTQADQGFDIVYKNIVQVVSEIKTDQTKSIGLAWPGFVTREGQIKHAQNIPEASDVYLARRVQEEINIPTFICNDAKLFTLAESLEKKAFATLGIICGTGVGSGFVMNNELVLGAHGFSNEVGHMVINSQKVTYLFAGKGIHAFCREQGWEDDVYAIQDAMRLNKELYISSMMPLLDLFTGWLRDVVLVLDPDDIVFGGSVGIHFWSIWKEEIESLLTKKLEEYPNTVSIRFSALENAGALGAGMFGKENLN